MIQIQLPAPQSPAVPAFDVTAVLDAVAYTLRLQWSVADGHWFLQVLDEPGQTVLMGDTRLVADWPLYRNRSVRTPPGLLLCRDTTGEQTDPGLSDLGGRHQLFYVEAAELPEGF